MNPLVETVIASKLRKLTLEQVATYIAGDGSLVKDFFGSSALRTYGSFLALLSPDDFNIGWVRNWFRMNRPDLWQVLSTPEGERWLSKTCTEIQFNLRRLQSPTS